MTDRRTGMIAFALVMSPALVIAGIGADASVRRARSRAQQPAVDALAARLPTSDLALAGGARWLRSPSLEEPGAAFADGPALPDPDPAGGAMAPPVGAWPETTPR
jgi:hypothetical protein